MRELYGRRAMSKTLNVISVEMTACQMMTHCRQGRNVSSLKKAEYGTEDRTMHDTKLYCRPGCFGITKYKSLEAISKIRLKPVDRKSTETIR